MSRRSGTLLVGIIVAMVLGMLGGSATVPYVALGPGPTYDTLGAVAGRTVVEVRGEQTFPTAGDLRMTTVSVTDGVTLFGALGLWASGRYALVPRDDIFPPGRTQQQVEQENARAFQDSETAAETAALRYLGYPTVATVERVIGGTPADGVLKPGDELLAVDGQPVATAEQVVDAFADTRPGQQVQVSYQRGAAPPVTATIALGVSNDRPHGFLGIVPGERADVAFEISIRLADVGGPSAGLTFALAIVDKLRPGALTAGAVVAGTGTITPDGRVGSVGGIPFKMVAAREQGATVFLVPAGNCAEAAQHAPDGLVLVRVGTLGDAVRAMGVLQAGGWPTTCP